MLKKNKIFSYQMFFIYFWETMQFSYLLFLHKENIYIKNLNFFLSKRNA